jgi:hypothetical protein
MDVSNDISPELLQNSDLFKNDFYSRFPQKTYTLNLNESISKDYLFPTFYGNVTQSVGIFLCSYEKAQKLMPAKTLKPVKMGGGKTLVIFSCYEYANVNQIACYNEIAMTIPVLHNPVVNIPVLPMLASNAFKKFGYFVFSMPVTSLENKIRGNKIWGLPKVTQKIDFTMQDNMRICSAYEESGEKYFELKVPVTGKIQTFDESGYLYSRLDDNLLKSRTFFTGDYTVSKNMGRLFGAGQKDTKYLWTGDTPSGRILNDLEIDEHPFQFRYAEEVCSCFDLPESSIKVV